MTGCRTDIGYEFVPFFIVAFSETITGAVIPLINKSGMTQDIGKKIMFAPVLCTR